MEGLAEQREAATTKPERGSHCPKTSSMDVKVSAGDEAWTENLYVELGLLEFPSPSQHCQPLPGKLLYWEEARGHFS